MRQPLPDEQGRYCGCEVIDGGLHSDFDILYCARHKPAWRAGLEGLITHIRRDRTGKR